MKNMKTLMAALVVTFSAVVLVTACGKKDDGGSSSSPTVPAVVCPVGALNCVNTLPGGVGSLLNNVQFSHQHMTGILNISAVNTGTVNLANPNAYMYYMGPVAITGQLQVLDQTLCGAAPGAYTLTSVSMGGTSNLIGGRLS